MHGAKRSDGPGGGWLGENSEENGAGALSSCPARQIDMWGPRPFSSLP